MSEPIQGKQEKILKLYEASIVILLKGGVSDLTHARLARSAKISRAWIYKYFGKSSEELIGAAVQHFGRTFADLDDRQNCSGTEEQIQGFRRGTEKLLSFTGKYPWVLPMYFRYRGSENSIGKQIGFIEGEYLKVLAREAETNLKFHPDRAQNFAQMLLSSRLGIAYRWQTTDLSKKVPQSVILDTIETWVRASVNAKL